MQLGYMYMLGMLLGAIGGILHLIVDRDLLKKSLFNVVRSIVIGAVVGYMLVLVLTDVSVGYMALVFLSGGYFSEYMITNLLKHYSPYEIIDNHDGTG